MAWNSSFLKKMAVFSMNTATGKALQRESRGMGRRESLPLDTFMLSWVMLSLRRKKKKNLHAFRIKVKIIPPPHQKRKAQALFVTSWYYVNAFQVTPIHSYLWTCYVMSLPYPTTQGFWNTEMWWPHPTHLHPMHRIL